MTPHHEEVVFDRLGDLQRRLEAVRLYLYGVTYARCYAKRWWSDLTEEEQDAVIAAEQPPEVWAIYGLEEHEPLSYFRVRNGVFERWTGRSWVHVTSELGRDYLMRRTIMGDGAMRATDEQVARLKAAERKPR